MSDRPLLRPPHNRLAIVGGGPAGLMAAELAVSQGAAVTLFDAMPSVGRKFLLAGKGGMNITHSEPLDDFLARYGQHQAKLHDYITAFPPEQLRAWIHTLGIDTFVGSSGRVFPTEMKAAPLLRSWLGRLRQAGVSLQPRHRLRQISRQRTGWCLHLDSPAGAVEAQADAVILALGGGSWPQLGSDGQWLPLLTGLGARVAPLVPANCGFDTHWSDYLLARHAGEAVKTLAASCVDAAGVRHSRRGECMVTQTGLEGGLIYALSAPLREAIERQGHATLFLDLLPDRDAAWVAQAVAHPRGARSLGSHLASRLKLKGVKVALLHECCDAATLADPQQLAQAIKHLPVVLHAPRPLAEAISSAGGVEFASLDPHLMLTSQPGIFCAGEMLDWDAPTGGYLLTACFATGRAAAAGALDWLARAAPAGAL